jgi:hypothetical protein
MLPSPRDPAIPVHAWSWKAALTPKRVAAALVWRLDCAYHAVISTKSLVILRATDWHAPDDDPLLKVEDCSSNDEAIGKIYEKLGRKITTEKIESRKRHGLSFFRIDLNGSLVGSIWLVHSGRRYIDEVGLTILTPPSTVWVRDAWVDGTCRGQRVFKRALAKILETYYPDVRTLWSDTAESNHTSLRGHKAAGFEAIGVIRCVRVNPFFIFRSTQVPGPLKAVDFQAERQLILQSPAFHQFNRNMLA